MGLTKEVKDFFKNCITKLIQSKIDEVFSHVDKDEVEKACLNKLLMDVDAKSPYDEYMVLSKSIDELGSMREVAKDKLEKALKSKYPAFYFPHYASEISGITALAEKNFYTACFKELYPETAKTVAKYTAIMEDVEGVVLLATTERSLVDRLTDVLKKYGGDISELLDYIPE